MNLKLRIKHLEKHREAARQEGREFTDLERAARLDRLMTLARKPDVNQDIGSGEVISPERMSRLKYLIDLAMKRKKGVPGMIVTERTERAL